MLIRHVMNEGIVRYLERKSGSPSLPDVRPPRDNQRDYWECGAHPDIVERVWDQLGKALPVECRQVILGSPTLVHPDSGVILAIAIGTQYGLRLPSRVSLEPVAAGMRTKTVWSGGSQMDIQQEFGTDWVFGTWSSDEEAWCLEVFRERGVA
jgi:hypothetical protein